MAADVVKVRMVVARDPDFSRPIVCGAWEEDTWEVIPPDEWDAMVRRAVRENAPGAVEHREVVVSFSASALGAMFEHDLEPLDVAAAPKPDDDPSTGQVQEGGDR